MNSALDRDRIPSPRTIWYWDGKELQECSTQRTPPLFKTRLYNFVQSLTNAIALPKSV
ncbi:MAG: hypothetical protein SAK29_03520 [Scytonema sp. PMC 1069.18]|nr:hypothetical protein [Scytonema sp. PMC 1069.18]